MSTQPHSLLQGARIRQEGIVGVDSNGRAYVNAVMHRLPHVGKLPSASWWQHSVNTPVVDAQPQAHVVAQPRTQTLAHLQQPRSGGSKNGVAIGRDQHCRAAGKLYLPF